MPRPRALLSWSSGKDAAWSLHRVRHSGEVDVVGLVTTLNEAADRVAMHGVRHDLLRRQADAAGLPLYPIGLPAPCSNDDYERLVGGRLGELRDRLGVSHMVFGDLFLADIRAYRERQMAAVGLTPLFPLWEQPTEPLARDMLAGGLVAHLTCVDTEQLAAGFSGRRWDAAMLADLPPGVDPCGENGEFHTLVTAGPMFSQALDVVRGEQREEPRFVFTDFLPV